MNGLTGLVSKRCLSPSGIRSSTDPTTEIVVGDIRTTLPWQTHPHSETRTYSHHALHNSCPCAVVAVAVLLLFGGHSCSVVSRSGRGRLLSGRELPLLCLDRVVPSSLSVRVYAEECVCVCVHSVCVCVCVCVLCVCLFVCLCAALSIFLAYSFVSDARCARSMRALRKGTASLSCSMPLGRLDRPS